jgi:hypothetical protein
MVLGRWHDIQKGENSHIGENKKTGWTRSLGVDVLGDSIQQGLAIPSRCGTSGAWVS